MSERHKKPVTEIVAAWTAGLPHFERKLLTSDKYIMELRPEESMYGQVAEIPMSIKDSIANSITGQFIARARRALSSRAHK